MLEYVYSAAASPNYRYYVGPGTTHTVMGDNDLFYNEVSSRESYSHLLLEHLEAAFLIKPPGIVIDEDV